MSQYFENKELGEANWQMPDAWLLILVTVTVTNDSNVDQMKASLRGTCVHLTSPNAVDTPGDVLPMLGDSTAHSN